MRGSGNFLDKPADELTEFLLGIARADVAPQAARERALQNVASAALGIGVLSGTAVVGSRTSLFKGTSWLVAKWLAAGVSSGLLTIGVAQTVTQLATNPPAPPAAPPALRTPSHLPPRLAARSVPSAPELSAPELAPIPALPALAAEAAASAPVAAPSPEPKSTSRASSDASMIAAPLASSASSLTRELTLLERVRSALTGHSASGALRALDEYGAEFPHGSMQVEAAALRVEAVAQSGDHALAQRLAQSFLTSFPKSPLAARVRSFLIAPESEVQKP